MHLLEVVPGRRIFIDQQNNNELLIINLATVGQNHKPFNRIAMIKYFAFYCFLFATQLTIAQTITVKQLYDEHRNNKYVFQNKYKNQVITVAGKIRSISPASDYWKDQDVHRVHLTATGYENFVVCELPYKDTGILNLLKVGDYVTVTGKTASNIGDAVNLSNCSFTTSAPTTKKSTAPENAPVGKYDVYQDDGNGFNYQYAFYLKSYNSYELNGKTGACAYNSKTKVITFSTGPLKGFAGLYRKATDNEADPPGFLLNAKGTIPDLSSSRHGYQHAYLKIK